MKKVGIVGFGNLGQYLTKAIMQDEKIKAKYEIAFVWNRTIATATEHELLKGKSDLILHKLEDFKEYNADIIVEVAHPSITKKFGADFASCADYFVGSPTIFADIDVEKEIRAVAENNTQNHGVYIPAGALWGADDIQKMSDRGTLEGLTVTMKKHPASLKVEAELIPKVQEILKRDSKTDEIVYEGPVRGLCPLAPKNVNTMACAALAGYSLGFDKVQARLIANTSLTAHVIDIDVKGPGSEEGCFSVSTTRYNPAKTGAVTGNATYGSFLSSILRIGGRGNGIHFC
eukprot:TRINITY_DN6869_c0_g1_i1.p1 TRINITY_DN6869_c0_g1~~TRINITY_DN6869_c0_g1_i1.p1  ORF type:complete len:288 (-),score=60.38 TRINITY_DN6869_c0_g1_i1:550-1413(-)